MKPTSYYTETNDDLIEDRFMPQANAPLTMQHEEPATRGFADKFGLDLKIGALVIVTDTMLFGGDLVAAPFFIPLTIAVAFGLGIATFVAQKKWYGDDNEAALWKACVVCALTAIPTSLPGYLTLPATALGLFRSKES